MEAGELITRLEAIEHDLEIRQGPLAEAAQDFYTAKRDYEKEFAEMFLTAAGSVEHRKAQATILVDDTKLKQAEAEFEARKRVIGVLDTRAAICMSLAKAGR